MFGRDVLVFHFFSDLLCILKNRVCASREVLLSARNFRKLGDRSLHICNDRLCICTDLTEYRADDTFLLFEHRREQMLRLDLLILFLFRSADRSLNRLLTSNCESVESHFLIPKL